MLDKQAKLKRLQERNEELKPIIFKGANSENELELYIKTIKDKYEEYYNNQEEIQKLEYELMSPKEREEYDEYRRLSKLKAQGKFPL